MCSVGFMKKLLLRDDDSLDHLMNTLVKETLEIPENVTWGGQSNAVFNALYEDFMKPATEVGMYRLEQLAALLTCRRGKGTVKSSIQAVCCLKSDH